MYSRETADANLTRLRHLRRPVLLVDHDREFGTLMRVAFEARGEHLEWTDRINDALRILACGPYDPVIIDLRLYDGSGLHLLEEAVNNHLLAPGSAVILASHDFVESSGSISPSSWLDLDAFLDRLFVLTSGSSATSESLDPRLRFVLYISEPKRGADHQSGARAFSNVRFFLRDLVDDEWMVA